MITAALRRRGVRLIITPRRKPSDRGGVPSPLCRRQGANLIWPGFGTRFRIFPLMACRGVLFAITNGQAEELRAARGDDSTILSIVQDEIEEAWDEEHLCQTDKAWDAIHRCLADGTLGNG